MGYLTSRTQFFAFVLSNGEIVDSCNTWKEVKRIADRQNISIIDSDYENFLHGNGRLYLHGHLYVIRVTSKDLEKLEK